MVKKSNFMNAVDIRLAKCYTMHDKKRQRRLRTGLPNGGSVFGDAFFDSLFSCRRCSDEFYKAGAITVCGRSRSQIC